MRRPEAERESGSTCRGRALTMRTGSDKRAESIALDCKRLRVGGSRARILCQVASKAWPNLFSVQFSSLIAVQLLWLSLC